MSGTSLPLRSSTPPGHETRCARQGCPRPVEQAGRGRPALYCGERCRRSAYRERRRLAAAAAAVAERQARELDDAERRSDLARWLVTEAAGNPSGFALVVAGWMGRVPDGEWHLASLQRFTASHQLPGVEQ